MNKEDLKYKIAHSKYGIEVVELLRQINEPEYTKRTIKLFGRIYFTNDHIMLLIEQINEPEYTKEIIENWKEYGLTSANIRTLVEKIGEIEYTKGIIENWEKYKLDSYDILQLIQTINEPEYIKGIIENWKKYSFNGGDVEYLAIKLNEPEYIKGIIENWKEYELDGYNIESLARELNKPEYIKGIIENWKEYELDGSNIVRLARELNEPEYIKGIIENWKEYGLDGSNIVRLAIKLNESEYIKGIIENWKEYGLSGSDVRELAETIGEPEYIKGIIYGLSGSDVRELAETIGEPEYIKGIIENWKEYGFSGSDVRELAETIREPEYIKGIIENWKEYGLNSSDIIDLINKIDEVDYTKYILENWEKYNLFDNSENFKELLLGIDDWTPEGRDLVKKLLIEYKKYGVKFENFEKYVDFFWKDWTRIRKFRKDGFSGSDVRELAETIEEPEYIKGIIENWKEHGLSGSDVIDLINKINEVDYTKYILENWEKYNLFDNSENFKELLLGINCDIAEGRKLVKKLLIEYKKYGVKFEDFAECINSLCDNEKDILDLLNKLDKEDVECYRTKCADESFVRKYLAKFIELEGADSHIIAKMLRTNRAILKCKFSFLTQKYIDIFGGNMVNQIACYPDVVDKILEFEDDELAILGKVMAKWTEISEGEEKTVILNRILEHIGDYRELIESVNSSEDFDIGRIIPILIYENSFGIRTIDDIENFGEIKRRKCEELMQSDSIEEKRRAVILKIFGQDLEEVESIISRFGEDIGEIEDEDLKNYVRSLQEILSVEDEETLGEIFRKVNEIDGINSVLVERKLKNAYWKLYQKDLFRVEGAKRIKPKKGIEEGIPLYSAGTDFKMIITSVGAFRYIGLTRNNYRRDWNRDEIEIQHFCASYIRNDMLGHAPVYTICYGFENFDEDALMLSAPMDLLSEMERFEAISRKRK